MSVFRRRSSERGADRSTRADVLIVGLGNPGDRYERTRHNIGFQVAAELADRWQLGKPRKRFGGLIADGRIRPGGPRVAVLQPLTFMNESGTAASPARGELGLAVDRVAVIHDEIDLPFGRVEARQGGGLAGHNGLKSLKRGFGGDTDFWRIRTGVGRPDSTDSEIVMAWVLGRFSEPPGDVAALVGAAADEAERVVERLAAGAGDDLETDETDREDG